MTITYTAWDLLLYLIIYAFFGWVLTVFYDAVRYRRFINRGFLNLPLSLPYGIAAAVLLPVLATLNHNLPLQYLTSAIVCFLVMRLSDQFVRGISRNPTLIQEKGTWSILLCLAVAAVLLTGYLVIHPWIFGLVQLMPDWLPRLAVIAGAVLIAVDFASVVLTLRTNTVSKRARARQEDTHRLADRIITAIWRRLQKAYPGIETEAVTDHSHRHVFARGMCFDKLVWVFLVSSFLGALIEMCYCRIAGGVWMNRSSVLYGPFSFVWGFGAVLLTVSLQRLAGKQDRYVFLAGFVIGGVYEYLCSVFTELLFGTVFWDYSDMPLNIGGRTNVLYCIFWGLLAVFWIKVIYPPMSAGIEKLPPLLGKVTTWVVLLLMLCNGLLTACAMIRCTARQTDPAASNVIEVFFDTTYDDAYMKNRWPNMEFAQ